MDIINQHFPHLSEVQKEQFSKLKDLYVYWNEKINVISRKDIENLYEKHVLHSLGIAKIIEFKPDSDILDVGTGGGFPGIPLAIMFPDSRFHLVDSIGKKILVVEKIANELGLKNVKAEKIRAEEIKQQKYDFVVSRAVSKLDTFHSWVRNKFKKRSEHRLKNGLIFLKGGDLAAEIKASKLRRVREHNLHKYFPTEFFETKKVIYVPSQ